jgi:hypothetical protein
MHRIMLSVAAVMGLAVTTPSAEAHGGRHHRHHGRHVRAAYYHRHGHRFHGGYYYRGRYHYHWSRRVWVGHYRRYHYYDPGLRCWYYWVPARGCYYPVPYVR